VGPLAPNTASFITHVPSMGRPATRVRAGNTEKDAGVARTVTAPGRKSASASPPRAALSRACPTLQAVELPDRGSSYAPKARSDRASAAGYGPPNLMAWTASGARWCRGMRPSHPSARGAASA
jgi:hypothetical protein